MNSAAQSGTTGDTVTGGAGTLVVNATGSHGIDVNAGSGNVTLNGGSGNDIFAGGAGQAQLNLGAGADTVTLGQGSITVQGGLADTFMVPGSADGTLIVQNWTAQDSIVTPGLSQPAIAAETVLGGLHLPYHGRRQPYRACRLYTFHVNVTEATPTLVTRL